MSTFPNILVAVMKVCLSIIYTGRSIVDDSDMEIIKSPDNEMSKGRVGALNVDHIL